MHGLAELETGPNGPIFDRPSSCWLLSPEGLVDHVNFVFLAHLSVSQDLDSIRLIIRLFSVNSPPFICASPAYMLVA